MSHHSSLKEKKPPNPSFLRRLPGRITQHFHLPLIDHNLVTWPQLFARKSGKCSLLTELTLGGCIHKKKKMAIGWQTEVSVTTLNIFNIKFCVCKFFKVLILCPILIYISIYIVYANTIIYINILYIYIC